MKRTNTPTFEFHHIGIACKNFDLEQKTYSFWGYQQENSDFQDDLQGVLGRFLVAPNQPRIELLQNTPTSHTLDLWLKKRTKMYHLAYLVKDLDAAVNFWKARGGGMVKEPLPSSYFKKRICFMLLPNMLLIELIEKG